MALDFVKLDLKTVEVKYFLWENWRKSSREARNKKLISEQQISEPDSKIDSCKSVCRERAFPSRAERVSVLLAFSVKALHSKRLQKGIKFHAEIKVFFEE